MSSRHEGGRVSVPLLDVLWVKKYIEASMYQDLSPFAAKYYALEKFHKIRPFKAHKRVRSVKITSR
jgi:hypothetical protein